MKRFLPLLLALMLALQTTACAAPAAVTVTRAEADQLELSLDGVPESMLITAVYLGGRMVDSVVSYVLTGTATVIAQFHNILPEGSVLKSFVLDRETATPLLPASELKPPEQTPDPQQSRVLVAYFSATNTTKPLAEYASNILDADLYEIVPEVPYTSADLAYYTGGRADQEQNDPSARPAIRGSVRNMDDYDIVFIGYPIWHGQAPRIISTFLEGYDFSGKTVVPFCTSHSSPIGSSDTNLHALAPSASWLPGRRFAAGTSKEAIQTWIDTLELPKQEETTVKQITLSFNGHTYPATLEDNPTAEAFAELLQSKDGSMTISMEDYMGWEKVGSLGQSLPSNNVQTTTTAGDFVLYSGNQIVLFYGSNSWSYTRLGRLDNPAGLQAALGSGDVAITFQLLGG